MNADPYPFFTTRADAEAACERLAALRAPQVPLGRAVADARIGLVAICDPTAPWPKAAIERITRPIVVLVGADVPASSALTQERLGWRPTHTGMISDLENFESN